MSHKLDLGYLFCKQKAKFRSWKMSKDHGKGTGKCWNFKRLKGYKPCYSFYILRNCCERRYFLWLLLCC